MTQRISEKETTPRLPDSPALGGLRWFRRKTLTGGEQARARFQVRLMGVIHSEDLGTMLRVMEQAKEQFFQSPSRFNARDSFRLFENMINLVKIRERQVITASKDVPEGRGNQELSRARLRLEKARQDLREIVCSAARNELRDHGRRHAEYARRKFDGIGVGGEKRLFEEIERGVRAKFVTLYPELDPSCLRKIGQVVEDARPDLEKWLSVQRPRKETSLPATLPKEESDDPGGETSQVLSEAGHGPATGHGPEAEHGAEAGHGPAYGRGSESRRRFRSDRLRLGRILDIRG
ncbi:MAG: hypothetical protein KAJ81_07215 [Candidatus Latescibacteria bacterium]|nr:hypothetical protein [Candidatus Latescibacterota bacterium]